MKIVDFSITLAWCEICVKWKFVEIFSFKNTKLMVLKNLRHPIYGFFSEGTITLYRINMRCPTTLGSTPHTEHPVQENSVSLRFLPFTRFELLFLSTSILFNILFVSFFLSPFSVFLALFNFWFILHCIFVYNVIMFVCI